jgi:hypothetical protein
MRQQGVCLHRQLEPFFAACFTVYAKVDGAMWADSADRVPVFVRFFLEEKPMDGAGITARSKCHVSLLG